MDWINLTKKAIRYIENELDNTELSPKTIANHIHVSESHFTRAFRVLTKCTLSEYIRSRRLSVAGNLLQNADQSVLEVAISVGYESPEAFSKAFKRFHGIKPSECKGAQLQQYYPFTLKLILTQEPPLEFYIEQKGEIYLFGDTKTVPSDDSNAASYLWAQCEISGFIDNCNMSPDYKTMVGMSTPNGYTIKAMSTKKNNNTLITIPKHNWVVFPCLSEGPLAILQVWDQIYSNWMAKAEYEISDYPQLEVYTDTDDGYTCEIWIAIE